MVEEKKVCDSCGGDLISEDRRVQFNRIKNGLSEIFVGEEEENIDNYTRNFIGYGPNYMYICSKCKMLTKIIPDGRRKY